MTATGAAYLQKDIEDVSFMTMHFADKTMAHIHVSWLDPHKERKLTVVGSKMMAVFDDTGSSEKIWLYDKGVETKLDYNTYGEYLQLESRRYHYPPGRFHRAAQAGMSAFYRLY